MHARDSFTSGRSVVLDTYSFKFRCMQVPMMSYSLMSIRWYNSKLTRSLEISQLLECYLKNVIHVSFSLQDMLRCCKLKRRLVILPLLLCGCFMAWKEWKQIKTASSNVMNLHQQSALAKLLLTNLTEQEHHRTEAMNIPITAGIVKRENWLHTLRIVHKSPPIHRLNGTKSHPNYPIPKFNISPKVNNRPSPYMYPENSKRHVWARPSIPALEIHIYSAYLDTRLNSSHPTVRLIVVGEVNNVSLNCIFVYNRARTKTSPAYAILAGPELDIDDKVFTSYIYTCDLSSSRVPDYVTLTKTTSNTHEQIKSFNRLVRMGKFMETRHLVPVNVPIRSRRVKDFILCVSVSYGALDPFRMIEWFELYQMWGVNKVSVYNNSLAQSLNQILQYYKNIGFLEIHDAPNCRPGDDEPTILLNMSPTLCNSISALTIKPWLGAERLLLVSDLNTNKITTTITSGLRRLGFYMDHRVTGSCWRDSWA